ncbi:hypothetical protein B0H16DRAFT_1527805 [Mycena metata]|uniref:F-box domain-containing protein n=1 Tax=Mycena metata TaxID=1033252 RepID=A0AAD7JEU6_9AGAR|nr:hypothetical protein B0H16DRAFT_1527805 [Mycena metata]
MPRAGLPRELYDLVVDYLHAERATLGSCALVCRAWIPASRFHLFAHISLTEHEGHVAARLNELLASPHATFASAVRSLDFYNALSPVQIRHSRTGRIQVKTLVEIVPRIAQLHHIQTLTLSDLPLGILPAFSKVKTLSLVGITAGPVLLQLATHLPKLTRLTLKRVHAIPYRASSPAACGPEVKSLQRLAIRGSSLAFLGWLAVLAPRTSTLDLGDFCPSEVAYLSEYLRKLDRPLAQLHLGLSQGADVREFAWEELVRVLGVGTRVIVCMDQPERESGVEGDEQDDEDVSILRFQFRELEKRGMLVVRR